MAGSNAPLAVVAGAGPGLGAALAARFAQGGHEIALLSRSAATREVARDRVAAAGHAARGYDCDMGNPEAVAAAFAAIRGQQGDPTVLVYNAGIFLQGGILELDPAAFEAAWRVNCLGAYLAAREVLPAMLAAGRGSILLTGATAALRGGARFAGLAVGKFGLRALAQSLAREFAPQGIHVAHVVIDGLIATDARRAQAGRAPGSLLEPDAIAESYFQLHGQPRSAWTLELDLRPSVEKF